jgi:hypothetical protein
MLVVLFLNGCWLRASVYNDAAFVCRQYSPNHLGPGSSMICTPVETQPPPAFTLDDALAFVCSSSERVTKISHVICQQKRGSWFFLTTETPPMQSGREASSSTFNEFLNRALSDSAAFPYPAPASDHLQAPCQPASLAVSPVPVVHATSDKSHHMQGLPSPDPFQPQSRRCEDCGITQTAQWYVVQRCLHTCANRSLSQEFGKLA